MHTSHTQILEWSRKGRKEETRMKRTKDKNRAIGAGLEDYNDCLYLDQEIEAERAYAAELHAEEQAHLARMEAGNCQCSDCYYDRLESAMRDEDRQYLYDHMWDGGDKPCSLGGGG